MQVVAFVCLIHGERTHALLDPDGIYRCDAPLAPWADDGRWFCHEPVLVVEEGADDADSHDSQ